MNDSNRASRVIARASRIGNGTGNEMDIMISLVIYLVVFGLIWWLVSLLPLPAPVAQVVRVLFILMLIVIILSAAGIIPGGYLPHFRF